MNRDLRNRLEEAADKYAHDVATTEERGWLDRTDIYAIAKDAHIAGADFGYKEAINDAKKWLLNNANDYESAFTGAVFHQQLADAFEADMSKLLEE